MELIETTLPILPRLVAKSDCSGLLVCGANAYETLESDLILALLEQHDLVVLRGFKFDFGAFEELGKGLFQDVFTHHNRARRRIRGSLGSDLLPADGTYRLAHIERGYAPGIPDLVAFFCEQPATEGGYTTFHHGVEIFQNLPVPAKRFFSQALFRWKLRVRKAVWCRVLGVRSEAAAELQYAKRISHYVHRELGECVSYSFSGTDLLIEFVTPAVRPHRVSGAPMFINGSLAFLQDVHAGNAESGMLTLENGSPVPVGWLEDALESASDCAISLNLQSGDIAIANNHVVLHGRTPFNDRSRRMMLQFGMRA